MQIIFDDVLDNFKEYSEYFLNVKYEDIETPAGTFKNIYLVNGQSEVLVNKVQRMYPDYEIYLNFVRKSPLNQEEPNYIHSDIDMGDFAALFYLNSKYPDDAGTIFYENKETGSLDAEDIEDYSNSNKFKPSIKIGMRSNRLVLYDARLYHSRALKENFEQDGETRLVQVMFLKKKDDNKKSETI